MSIDYLRQEYPGKPDTEIALELARKYGYVAVVRYRSQENGEFDNIATCDSDEKLTAYKSSPYCHDVEVLYDARSRVIKMTPDTILLGKCHRCGQATSEETLVLMGGNDFYFCPKCGLLFCASCYPRLPLTQGDSGYGQCTECRIEVKRALPGAYGT